MRNIATKVDNVDTLSAAEFNGSIMTELENAVTKAGITLDTATDTDTEMLAQALVRTSQTSSAYQDSGAADAYVLTASLATLKAPTAYLNGMTIEFKAGNTNTGASTVNVAGVGVKDLVDASDTALAAGAIVTGVYYNIVYNSGTDNFEVTNSAATGAVVVGDINSEASTVGQVITSDGAGNAAWEDKEQFLHVQDQKANGTDGGTATSGSYQTRDLNTVETNEIAGASLAANRITLAAGTYYVEWSAPAHADGAVTSRHKTRLSNISGAAVSIIGTSEFVESSGSEPVTTRSFGAGRFTIAGSTVLELQHRVEVTNSADGFGQSVSFGDIEVYSDIKIWRIL